MNYERIYTSLVESRKAQVTASKKHYVHHIVPKAEGGSDDESNLVMLTAREHYIAHLLLAKIYNDKPMWCAVQMMGKKFKHSSRLFEKLSKNFRAWNKGKQLSEECRRKISQTLKGRKLPKKTREKMSKSKKGKLPNFTGHHHTEETRRRISEAMKRHRQQLM